MAHILPLVTLQYEPRNRKFSDMVRSILVPDLQPLRYLLDGQFGATLQQVKNLEPAMIGEPFHKPLHGAIRPFFFHPTIIQTFCKTFERCGDSGGGGGGEDELCSLLVEVCDGELQAGCECDPEQIRDVYIHNPAQARRRAPNAHESPNERAEDEEDINRR